MELNGIKRIIAALATVLSVTGALSVLALGALAVVVTGTGADPSDAFTPTELVPEGLVGRVQWSDDAPDLDRPMEPLTRVALEAAWWRGVAAREVESAVTASASTYDLQVGFYSLDGQIVGLRVESLVTRSVGGGEVTLAETGEAVLVLTDGRWEIDQLVRTEAILIEP